MSLTSEDLLAISQLLDTKLDARLKPMENDIKSIRDEQILMKDEQRRFRDEQALMKNELKLFRDEQALMKEEQTRFRDELALMKEAQAHFRDEQTLMKKEQALMKDELNLVRDELSLVKKEQTRISLILENDVLHAVNILSENYLPAAKRYESATEKIAAMQTDIDIMKKVIADHSEKLQKIS